MKKIILLLLVLPWIINAQYLEILKVDTSSFPIIKAQFFSKNKNNIPIYDYEPSSFTILENGVPREVLGLECINDSIAPIAIVVAFDLTMDQTEDKGDVSREYIKELIDNLPDENAEMAIIGFTKYNSSKCEFTNDKYKLRNSLNGRAIEKYEPDYDAALITHPYGALRLLENKENHRKMVVIVTDFDYRDNELGTESSIIAKAHEIGASIFTVILSNNYSELLTNITDATGGVKFNGVNEKTDSKSQVKQFYDKSKINICELTWMSDYQCSDRVSIKFESESYSNDYIRTINLNKTQMNNIGFSHNSIDFPLLIKGETKEINLKLVATYSDVNIDSIQFTQTHPDFIIQEKFPIEIKKGMSRDIKVKYESITPSNIYSALVFYFAKCSQQISISASKPMFEDYIKTVSIIEPKVGDVLLAGSDTTISWSTTDISSPINLDYSIDNGENWTNLVSNFGGTNYIWTVPNTISDKCRLAISQPIKNQNKYAQIDWSKSYGGSKEDTPSSIIQVQDGGYLIVGDSESSDFQVPEKYRSENIWVLKIDSIGHIEWSKIFGGDGYDRVTTCLQLNNGDYIIVSDSDSDDYDLKALNKGFRDVWILRINTNGDIIWSETFGGKSSDEANSIQQTSDNGFILAGKSRSEGENFDNFKGHYDAWILKLDSSGQIEWSRTFGGSNEDVATSAQQTFDGGYIVSAHSKSTDYDLKDSFGGIDLFVVKLTNKGKIQWSKSIGDSLHNYSKQIIQSYDGNFTLLAGYRAVDPFEKDKEKLGGLVILRINSKGEVIWQKKDISLGFDIGHNIKQTPDGGYLVTGERNYWDDETRNVRGYKDALLFKIDPYGEKVWDKTFGGTRQELFSSCWLTNDGGYIVLGGSNSDNEDLTSNYGSGDLWVTKFKPDQYYKYSDTTDGFFKVSDFIPVSQNSDGIVNFSLIPNVITSSTNATFELSEGGETTLELFDGKGRLLNTILSGYQSKGFTELIINLSQYQSGRYYLRLTTSTTSRTNFLELLK